jgi:hypothetical protein
MDKVYGKGAVGAANFFYSIGSRKTAVFGRDSSGLGFESSHSHLFVIFPEWVVF